MLKNKKKHNQPVLFVYLKNSISLILFTLLRHIIDDRTQKSSNSVLFINTGQIGDIILSTTLFANEHNFHPKMELYFLLKEQYSDLFKGYFGNIKLIYWNQYRYRYSLIYRYKFIKKLHSLNLGIAINLTTARGPLNDEVTILSGAVTKYCLNNDYKYLKRIFGNYYDRFYSKIFCFTRMTELEKQVSVFSSILKQNINPSTCYFLTTHQIEEAKKILNKYSFEDRPKVIIVNPFSDIEQKNWPSKRYRELFQLLADDHILIICQGNTHQRRKIKKIIHGLDNVINIAGELTLSQSAAVIYISDLYIGNDSGFTHIAKALHKNTIAIIGGGSFGSFFPYHTDSDNIHFLYKDVDCKGCDWRCIHETHICLDGISAKQVYQLSMKILFTA